MQPRPYQEECISSIPDSGKYLIQMATGLGKTVTFANIPRRGRMLILSHREELVKQPLKYFDCTTGIEMANNSSKSMNCFQFLPTTAALWMHPIMSAKYRNTPIIVHICLLI